MVRSSIMSRRDLDFLLYEWLDVEDLPTRARYAEHGRETFDAVLDLSERLATDVFAPLNRLVDTDEPRMDSEGKVVMPAEVAKALATYTESGLPTSVFDADLGGMQLPFVVHAASSTWFQAACVGAFAYPFLAEGNASLLVAHGTPEQVSAYAAPVIEGRWYGTMALSEPQAGSSLGDITTRAVRQDDGSYRLTGTKMWISGGDHELAENIVHLVLARTPDAPAGSKGISLFIVPKHLVADDGSIGERNDVVLAGLNHKMGYRGTTNTLLNFGEGAFTPGGAGRCGRPPRRRGGQGPERDVPHDERGPRQRRRRRDGARLHGLPACPAVRRGAHAGSGRSRTRTRRHHRCRLVDHTDVRRMLLAQKSYVEGALALVLYCGRLVDEVATAESAEDRATADLLLGMLTPIAKSWPSQWCLAANDLAIQVHGGYGYTRDYAVEQFYRDNRLNPIHEGTHGIQALDLLGRKVVLDGGRGLELLASRMRATTARAADAGDEAATYAAELDGRIDDLLRVTATLWGTGEPEQALANATVYLEAAGHLVVAWLWLEQLLTVGDATGSFYDGKRAAARYFFRFELPTIGPKLDLLESLDRTTLDLDPASL